MKISRFIKKTITFSNMINEIENYQLRNLHFLSKLILLSLCWHFLESTPEIMKGVDRFCTDISSQKNTILIYSQFKFHTTRRKTMPVYVQKQQICIKLYENVLEVLLYVNSDSMA